MPRFILVEKYWIKIALKDLFLKEVPREKKCAFSRSMSSVAYKFHSKKCHHMILLPKKVRLKKMKIIKMA